MVGIYIAGGLAVVGLVVLMFFRQKWTRAGKKESRGRAEKIEEERIEEADRAESRGGAEKTEEERSKE